MIRKKLKKILFLTILYRYFNKIKKWLIPYLMLQYAIFRKKTLRIVVGSADVFDKDWIPTDIDILDVRKADHWGKYFKENMIDAILAEHVWEHMTLEDGAQALKNCHHYLKRGGYLRMAVPDGNHPDKEYIDHVKVNGNGLGASDHKVLYNHQTLSTLLKEAGFHVIPLEYFDSKGTFHYTEWDPRLGTIYRSKRFDERNQDGILRYTSLIVDAVKNENEELC